MDYRTWVNLLGRRADDAAVRDALAKAGVTKTLNVERDRTDVRADIKNGGMTLVFADDAYLNAKDLPSGLSPPTLAEVILILSHPKLVVYEGPLPLQLDRKTSQAALRSRFGNPYESNTDNRWDRWQVDGQLLTAAYSRDLQALNRVAVALPNAHR